MSRDQADQKGRMCDKEEEKNIRRNTNWYECGSNRMSWDFFFFPCYGRKHSEGRYDVFYL